MAGKKNMKVFLIVGGPGAGRTSVCRKLTFKNNWPVFSMGKVLRKYRNLNSDEESMDSNFSLSSAEITDIKDNLNQGNYVATDVISKLVDENLKERYELLNPPGILMDGFPRTIEQYEDLKTKNYLRIIGGIILEVNEKNLVERCKKRNLKIDRIDDKVGVLQRRIFNYREFTRKLADILSRTENFIKVNNDSNFETAMSIIFHHFNNLQAETSTN